LYHIALMAGSQARAAEAFFRQQQAYFHQQQRAYWAQQEALPWYYIFLDPNVAVRCAVAPCCVVVGLFRAPQC
jgi:hypothetical protein